MSGVDEILKFKKSEAEDFYKLLNCDENSSVEQIQQEYKQLALQYHPDKNAGDKSAEEKFQQLTEARDILCDAEKRANYDKWRNSGIAITYKQWVSMKDHVHQSMHWTNPKTKDRMLTEGGGGGSGPSSLGAGGVSAAHRRASEGGANLHFSGRTGVWGSEAPSEVVSKFRNYEI